MAGCDLCGKPIEAGQPRYGGAPFGQSRHWNCHVAKFGKPDDWGGAEKHKHSRKPPGPPREPRRQVLRPKVRKGPYNKSENARRDWRSFGVISEMGKRRIEIECPFCFATFWAYVWSISGGGKRCTNCGAMHTSYGFAYPVEGNEDLS